jgi:hypothetical protein
MQLATPNTGAESFTAAIARRMLSQKERDIGRQLPEAELAAVRTSARTLEAGIDVSREGVTAALCYQQVMAASAIERLFPGNAQLQLVARETANKAAAGLPSEDEGDSDPHGDMPRPRG